MADKKSVTRTGTIVRGGTRTKDGVPLGIHSYTGGEYGQWAGRSGRSIAGPYAKAMPAPTGEEVTGNRLNKVASALRQIGPAVRKATPAAPKQQVVSNVVRERVSPVPAAAAAPKAKETAYQRQQRMAQQKMGVVGPRSAASKTSSSAGGMRSTGGGSRSSGGGAVGSTSGTRGYSSGGNVGRGDVGAGRRGGGR
jgi:hypothetical protein